MKETRENRKLVKMLLNAGAVFQPQQAAELGSFGHVVLALDQGYKKGAMESPSLTKESQ